MKKIIIITASLLLIVIAGMSVNKPSGRKALASEISVQRPASENYQKYCAGCHGANLEKFAAKKWMEEDGISTVFSSIKFGIETDGMPSFSKTFADAEIEELASYVKKGVPEDRGLLKPAVTPGGVIESEAQRFVVDTVVTGLNVPWGLAFLPNGDMLITERAGTLHVFSKGKLSPPVGGLPPIMASGQGGLLDIALHPDYDKNGWIYFSYSALNTSGEKPAGNTAIMRARLRNGNLADQQVIYRGVPETERNYHYGCKIAFDSKGHIFFGNGDRGQHFDFPQVLDNSNGKIHRLNDDGTIPADNPFVNTSGAIPSIYSFGHRNPQGTCIHPVTGELWITEHGPRGGDEINLIRPGLNYGWPVICYGINYDGTILTPLTEKEGMEQPVYYWLPSIGPCGMTFVTGDRYKNWRNNLLVGSLSFKYLERIVINGHSVMHREKLLEGIGRVRNVVMSPDGFIYVAIETPGKILRLIPME
ncbi:MAG: PQQ-dependent sugar dehydrogenase [Bacteroidales bacterium]|jgi:glucose/arabinose dehydrogenase|nr:PQQ-dependent sugar dehydrogenase [Bacteroidales bacterium]